MPDYDVTPQNLRDFLAEKDNNDFIIDQFQKAFADYKNAKHLVISENICGRIKEELIKNDSEIRL